MQREALHTLSQAIKLSLAIPAYNESEGIRELLLHWHSFLKNQHHIAQFEMIICNDGSHDETGAILDALAHEYIEIRPYHFTENQGAAAALSFAIKKTTLDWVLLLDADGQCPIENLMVMLETLHKKNSLAVLGVRHKQDKILPRLGSVMSGWVCNLIHRSNISDFNSAFKLVYGPLLRSLVLETKGMNYSTEMTSRLLECGITLAEVKINHVKRLQGQSHMKFFKDSIHRFLFVCYLGLRQLLLKLNILRRPSV